VHLEERDIVFVRKNKMWVGDFSVWIVSDEERLTELHTDLCLLTVREKGDLYTQREVRRALEAGKFLKSMGYPKWAVYSAHPVPHKVIGNLSNSVNETLGYHAMLTFACGKHDLHPHDID
jgi:hypothetical protein